jgi:hypothetical protein
LEKHSGSRLSYLFTHLHLLSSYSFSSTLLSSNISLLSASSLLCFSSVHIVGSLTSKLPSIIIFGLGYKPTNTTGGTILYELEKMTPDIYSWDPSTISWKSAWLLTSRWSGLRTKKLNRCGVHQIHGGYINMVKLPLKLGIQEENWRS